MHAKKALKMWRKADPNPCEPFRARNFRLYALVAFVLLTASDVCAQNAEDTVAFILFGLE
jgi:hypothetical protein